MKSVKRKSDIYKKNLGEKKYKKFNKKCLILFLRNEQSHWPKFHFWIAFFPNLFTKQNMPLLAIIMEETSFHILSGKALKFWNT